MSKKEFIIPIVSIILLVLIGVLLVANSKSVAPTAGPTATSTENVASTSASTAQSSASPARPTGPSAAYYPYGTTVLAFNQAAGFKDGIAIRPIAILEDSRCPQGVQCIQAGTVRLSLRTQSAGVTKVVEADLNTPVMVGGDTVTLTAATPVPMAGSVKAEDSAYRFTFTVEPGKGATTASTTPQCYVGGCSAELCTDDPGAISTCIYRASYGCYKTATCERQSTGKCGWTQTDELAACLANPPAAS